jgi:triosephosphate isomerase
MAGNWKMNGTSTRCVELAHAVRAASDGVAAQVIVAPPATSLAVVSGVFAGSPVGIAGQNIHWAASGAFTGEIAPGMVAEYAGFVLVGHSERRQLFGETDDDTNRKVHAAFDHGLAPIICVGETAAQRAAGATDTTVAGQLFAATDGITAVEVERIMIAYEPVWSIGTGAACDPAEAGRVAGLVRGSLEVAFGPGAGDVRILYGGSVGPANVRGYLAHEDVDGALVGGASLDPAAFGALVRAADEAA